jgi:succinoglycan biosynthesis protein ExoA
MNAEPLLPTVSLVVPYCNERQHIETCVRSLLAQEVPAGGYEILVVDGMADDGTRDILTHLARDTPHLRVLDSPARSTPCAMDLGIQAARGRYIAIMGAHARYTPDYIRQSVAVLEMTGADNVGGAMICEAEGDWQQAIAAAQHSPLAVGTPVGTTRSTEGRQTPSMVGSIGAGCASALFCLTKL